MCELVTPADNIDIVYFALIIIGGYILYVIYNRTFKIKKIDLIVLLSTATFGIILTIVLRSILKGYVISLF